MEKISVAVRVRPPVNSECTKGYQWKLVGNTISLYTALGTPVAGQTFAFDHLFGTDVRNGTVYDLHTRGLITAAVRGFNGTVFAYGQTSSGKTYTMRGSSTDLGLIGLAVHEVFTDIQKMVEREFLIRVSYMEIYNEEINDLLSPDNRKLQVHENLEKGIFVAGLREEIVNSPEQVFELLEFGEAHRHVGKTNMNMYSSRSHTIFRMVIESKDKHAESTSACSVDAVRVSVLNLVDLAGSERVAKTGVRGVHLKEGAHINKSLMILGNVIKKLSDGAAKQGGHIPYRDSKLTRILQPALGGNAKTAIICTVAPDEVHIDETRGTLQFASRAKRITTCAQVNEILTDAALLKRQQQEIEDLRKKLQGSQSEVQEQEILRLRNDLLKYELEREKLSLELQEEKKAQLQREQRIKEQELKIENLSSLVVTSALDDPSNKENRKIFEKGPSLENQLITVRRQRQQSPVNYEPLSETCGNMDTNCSKGASDLFPQDFGNVADEDLWFNLNDGHALAEPDFLLSTPNRWTSSVGSTRERKTSSIADALISSRVKSEKYKLLLEEASKENIELKNQLQEQLMFQKQLENELFEMEKEVFMAMSMSEILEMSLEALRQVKVSASTAFQGFLTTETSHIHAAIMDADAMRNSYIWSLAEKNKELEMSLSKYVQENCDLRMENQALQEQLQISSALTIRGGLKSISKKEVRTMANVRVDELSFSTAQETSTPFALSDFKENSCHIWDPCSGQLSNGEATAISTYENTTAYVLNSDIQMAELDICAGDMQMDQNHVPDGEWFAKDKPDGSICQTHKEDCESIEEMHGITGESRSETERKKVVNERPIYSPMYPEDRGALIESLLMSREHIRGLEKQLLMVNLEKDRTCTLLKEHLHAHEESILAMKLEKLKFAKELKSIMEAIAVQDSCVTSICHGIEELEKGTNHGSLPQIISN